MSDVLTEEQMRNALFRGLADAAPKTKRLGDRLSSVSKKASELPRPSKLRVTLHVSKIFEGEAEVFIHESSTLSRLVAELEAKTAARKKKFTYIDVISVQQI